MIYLDNAATSWPKPPSVARAVQLAMTRPLGNPGRTHHRAALDAAVILSECRERLARLFGAANPLRICFMANTTEALNTAIKGVLRPGDHAICSSMEHNSVWRPLTALAARGVEFSVAQANAAGVLDAESVRQLLRPNTRLVAITHASNVCGAVQPIAQIGRICREHGALFLVDAAQSAGALSIDVTAMNIDLLAFPGHKGLLGPQGTGGLYVREGLDITTLKEGGTGSESIRAQQPEIYPDHLESGTLNLPGIAGLNAALAYLLERGVAEIARHESALTTRLVDGLRGIEGVTVYGPASADERAAVVSFNLRGWECTALAAALEDSADLACRAGLHCAGLAHQTLGTQASGTLRLSPGPFSTETEIDLVLAAVRKLQHQPRNE